MEPIDTEMRELFHHLLDEAKSKNKDIKDVSWKHFSKGMPEMHKFASKRAFKAGLSIGVLLSQHMILEAKGSK